MPKKRSRMISSSESDDELPLVNLKEDKKSTKNMKNNRYESSSDLEEKPDEILKSHKKRIKNLVDSDSSDDEDVKNTKKKNSILDSVKKTNQTIEEIVHENSDEELEEITSFQTKPKLNTTGCTSFMGEQKAQSTKDNKEHCNDNSGSGGNLMDYFDQKYNYHNLQKPKPVPKKISQTDLRKLYEPKNSYGSGWSNYKKTGTRELITYNDLEYDTQKAKTLEAGRKLRLERKHEMLKKRFPNQNDFEEVLLDYDDARKQKIVVDHRIVLKMKKHQIEAVKFLYDNVFGSVNDLNEHNKGSGCILAHCMGLGKTLSTIALIATVARYNNLATKRILILCPKSTILNWRDEFIRWIGSILTVHLFNFEDGLSLEQRVSTLENWKSQTYYDPGVLLLGYEAFRNLVLIETYGRRSLENVDADEYKTRIRKCLIDGTDLVVLDEGHLVKNTDSGLNRAVTLVKTPKRIILTGTPVQNNLNEYYCMVNFVKPMFLGTKYEFNNLFANPISNGEHVDSDIGDILEMKERSFILYSTLDPFIHRKNVSILKTFLPNKVEYCIYVALTDIQTTLYKGYLAEHPMGHGQSLFPDYTSLRKLWTHMRVLRTAYEKRHDAAKKQHEKRRMQKQYAKDVSIYLGEEDTTDSNADDSDENAEFYDPKNRDWWSYIAGEEEFETLLNSNKLMILFEIIKKCNERNEKLVVFSSFVTVLATLEYFLKKITNSIEDKNADRYGYSRFGGRWIRGLDYMRLDGSTSKAMRHDMIRMFNDTTNKRMRLFLISARAGGMGINLTGANRCVIVDASWNPANDQQNIFRIYRMGQTKTCYIYRLIASGTMEEKIYSRAVTKEAMSFRVIDKKQIDRHFTKGELEELYTLTEPDFEQRPELEPIVDDVLFREIFAKNQEKIYRYHTHDSLLDNKNETDLSEQEKAIAWEKHRAMLTQTNPNATLQLKIPIFVEDEKQPTTDEVIATEKQKQQLLAQQNIQKLQLLAQQKIQTQQLLAKKKTQKQRSLAKKRLQEQQLLAYKQLQQQHLQELQQHKLQELQQQQKNIAVPGLSTSSAAPIVTNSVSSLGFKNLELNGSEHSIQIDSDSGDVEDYNDDDDDDMEMTQEYYEETDDEYEDEENNAVVFTPPSKEKSDVENINNEKPVETGKSFLISSDSVIERTGNDVAADMEPTEEVKTQQDSGLPDSEILTEPEGAENCSPDDNTQQDSGLPDSEILTEPEGEPENCSSDDKIESNYLKENDGIHGESNNVEVMTNFDPVGVIKKDNKRFMVLKKTTEPTRKVLVEKNVSEGTSIGERLRNLRRSCKRPIKEEVAKVLQKPRAKK